METVQLNAETDAEIILRMADLMKQGSKNTHQAYGHYMEPGGAVCAMGACLKTAGVTRDESRKPNFNSLVALGLITWPQVPYPKDTERGGWLTAIQDESGLVSLPDAIISLNDTAMWDFAAIINWLRSVAARMVEPETPQNA